MGKKQKILTMSLWGILLLAMIGVVAGKLFWQKGRPAPEVLFPAAQYTLVDQNAQPFSQQHLKGKPYVAGFIFTQCPDICPRMTTQMAELQKELPADVHLVSFSVDPKRDTPEVLKKYAETYKADENRWHFLTGERDTVIQVVKDMKLVFKEETGDHPILHSERLLLIDGDNQIRGTYLSHSPEELENLVEDAKYLADHETTGAQS